MAEIIHIQVGQCGNQIGEKFWESILAEHGIDHGGYYRGSKPANDLGRSRVYFNETERGRGAAEGAAVSSRSGETRYLPRALCVDLEPGVIQSMQSERGPLRQLIAPSSFIHGINGASNNWARGHYTEGAELIGDVMERLHKQIEGCDRLQGFQVCHSIGGGTGSGLGTLLVSKIREEWPDTITATFSVVPSPKVSDTVVEPYNALLATHHLIENADECFLLDNEALYNISQRIVREGVPTYTHLNSIVARAMCGATASFRFAGQLNSDLRKLATNLIPFPRLHFFATSYAPLTLRNPNPPSAAKLIRDLFNPRSFLCALSFDQSLPCLTAATMFRGTALSSREVEAALASAQETIPSASFVPWICHPVTVSLCSTPSLDAPTSATGILNSVHMMDIFKRMDTQFSLMYRRKAFLHSYIEEGMDEMELTEAQSNLRDLIEQYQEVSSSDLPDVDSDSDSDPHQETQPIEQTEQDHETSEN